MPSLMEELDADQDPRVTCTVCAWIVGLPPKEQSEWDKVMSLRVGPRFRYTHTSIKRALDRREAPVSKISIVKHRQNGHRS